MKIFRLASEEEAINIDFLLSFQSKIVQHKATMNECILSIYLFASCNEQKRTDSKNFTFK